MKASDCVMVSGQSVRLLNAAEIAELQMHVDRCMGAVAAPAVKPVRKSAVTSIYDEVVAAARLCIEDAMKQTKGNVSEAAKLLGVNRTHMYRLVATTAVPPAKWRPRIVKTHVAVVQELANWRRP